MRRSEGEGYIVTRRVSEPGPVLEDAAIQSLDASRACAPELHCVRLVTRQGGLRSTC